MSAELRRAALQSWRQQGGIIVATSGLGAGVDIPDVHHVSFSLSLLQLHALENIPHLAVFLPVSFQIFHFLGSHTCVNYCQEIGRGGRDGKPTTATTFAADSAPAPFNLDSRTCRVRQLSTLLDAIPAVPCYMAVNRAACDVCTAFLQRMYIKLQ